MPVRRAIYGSVPQADQVTTYNILNEATIEGTCEQCWASLLTAFEGMDPWWGPYLTARRLGPIRSGEIGSVVEIRVDTRGAAGGFWDRARWQARVIDVDPGRRIVLESVKGDFRGTMRLLMEPVGASRVHISIRFMGDPAGGLRLRSAFVDVPGGFRTVVQEGFHRLEQHQQPGRMAA